ncbi:LysR family transcriptional regulator [uncultured Paraglaciecola sp.]|uniref:LysR family transcriptional regulator n=1 Tax=uncultured Paraglaciecola sp. TaxID=1765024 RepID=UPI00260AD442|nr:LysR family transcriptional regulator [uncultured Paraglaciecola sp.]
MDKFSDMKMFVSIVKHQGLAAAGRELGLSPATMTARLQALEERYGVKLLNRSTRHVSLTDSGELYHKACLEILDNVSEAENLIQNGVKEVKGPLRIAAPKDIGKQYILPILSEFCQQYPDVIPYLYLNDNLSNIAESGMDVGMICKDEQVSGADVLIALHARKSAHFIDDFLKMNPVGKVIVYLTGTDLYRDIPNGCKICENSMNLADAQVVSNDASLASIPQKFRFKSSVVQKSIYLPDLSSVAVTETNLFTVVGHLREVKQPFMAVESMQLLDGSVRLVLLGDAVALNYDSVAMGWQARDPRFEWLGRREYREALKWMQRSVATINTSLVEGGANSVGESIVLGVPVLASKIEGNVGMLGEDYDGYFSPDDKQELANFTQSKKGAANVKCS